MDQETHLEKVPLGGPLTGKSIIIDLDRLTIRQLVKMESGRVTETQAAIADLIVGGDLGEDASEAILDMRPGEFGAVVDAIKDVLLPKKKS